MTVRTAQYYETASVEAQPDDVLKRDHEAERELVQLTQRLFLENSGPHRRSILFAGVDEDASSSIWLATGVAIVLSRISGHHAHVLTGEGDLHTKSSPEAPKAPELPGVILEHFDLRRLDSSQEGISDRFATLAEQGKHVIVHLPNVKKSADLLSRLEAVDGVVLLVQASKTRHATLRAAERIVLSVPLPVLGIVLLNRTYPIPEQLYKIL